MVAGSQVREVLDALVDAGSWAEYDIPVPPPVGASATYLDQLAKAGAKSQSDESVIAGRAALNGMSVTLVVGDFAFLAGSVGVSAARRVITAVAAATEGGSPLLLLPTSGGTRMQEGTPAFITMVGISAALARHSQAGLPSLGWLRHPTTGGVMATWGSLGDLVWAEPGALVGFLGPAVYAALHGQEFPPGIQTSQHLADVGVIDGTCDLAGFRARAVRALDAWNSRSASKHASSQADCETVEPLTDDWQCVVETERAGRLSGSEVLALMLEESVIVHGTRAGEAESGITVRVGRLAEQWSHARRGVVAIAQLGGTAPSVNASDLRIVRRGIELARRWGMPVVSIVDTEGADLSVESEEGAIASEIARCLSALSTHPQPTLSLLVGAGCGGGALAMVPADRILADRASWISPLPPAGASVIVHRTPDRADEMARLQRIGAGSMLDAGIVDEIVDFAVVDQVAARVRAFIDFAHEPDLAERLTRFHG